MQKNPSKYKIEQLNLKSQITIDDRGDYEINKF